MFVNKLVYAIYFEPISAVKGFRLYMLKLLEFDPRFGHYLWKHLLSFFLECKSSFQGTMQLCC